MNNKHEEKREQGKKRSLLRLRLGDSKEENKGEHSKTVGSPLDLLFGTDDWLKLKQEQKLLKEKQQEFQREKELWNDLKGQMMEGMASFVEVYFLHWQTKKLV